MVGSYFNNEIPGKTEYVVPAARNAPRVPRISERYVGLFRNLVRLEHEPLLFRSEQREHDAILNARIIQRCKLISLSIEHQMRGRKRKKEREMPRRITNDEDESAFSSDHEEQHPCERYRGLEIRYRIALTSTCSGGR